MNQIIKSLLDLDRYKLTMSQFAFTNYKNVKVKYAFTNRAKDLKVNEVLLDLIPWIVKELESVKDLRFTFSELSYLRDQKIFTDDYLDFISYLKLPKVDVFSKGGILNIETEGQWAYAMFWETIILSVVSELYGREIALKTYCSENKISKDDYITLHSKVLYGEEGILSDINKPFYEEAIKRLDEKITILKRHPEIKFFDFSTRRRFSRELQRMVVTKLSEAFHKPQFVGTSQFMGTSNEYLAMKLGIKAGGTMAHEIMQVVAGLNYGNDDQIISSQYDVLRQWNAIYGYDLSVALTDTFGSDFFFKNCPKDIAEMYSFREDSSTNLYSYTEEVISLYKKYNIDYNEKVVVHSNSLDVAKIIDINSFSQGKINKVYGIGTNLSADIGMDYSPLSIVMKAVEADGNKLVKLSDNLAKAIGDRDVLEKYKKVFGYINTISINQIY